MQKLQQLARSRKFWAALVGLVLVVIQAFYPDLPLDEGQVTSAVYVLVAYILGVAIEDSAPKGAAR
jgi:uncharacterized membrane protein YdjX (TVP38/TMEM64 family)